MNKGKKPGSKSGMDKFRNKIAKLKDIWDKNKESLTAFICIAAVIIGYQLLTFNRYLPPQEGYQIFFQLMDQGRLPYRDFYFHVPPVFLFIIYAISKIFGTAYIVLRTYGILERVVIAILIYIMLSKVFSRFDSFVATLIGFFFYSSFNIDIPYLYYQTAFLITLTSSLLLLYSFDTEDPVKKGWMLIISGFISMVGFFTRQTSGPFYLLVFTLIVFFHGLRAQGLKSSLRQLLDLYIGMSSAAAIFLFYLLFTGSLPSYFGIIFQESGSKGSIPSILTGFIPRLFYPVNVSNFVFYAFIFCLLIYISRVISGKFRPRDANRYFEKVNVVFYIFSSIAVSACIIYAYLTPSHITELLFITNLFPASRLVTLLTFFCLNIYFLIFLASWIKDPTDTKNRNYLFLSSISLAWMYTHGFSGVLEEPSLFLALPLLLLTLIYSFKDTIFNITFRVLLIYASVVFIILFASLKFCRPYSWWGWDEPDVRTAKYSSNIPALSGLYLSKNTLNVYNSVYEIINKYSRPGDPVYFFPHISLFNVISNRTNSLYTPVNYYDICSDKYAIQTSQQLKMNPPNVMIVMDFPEKVQRIHEVLFREGRPSGQRKIIQTIDSMLRAGKYRMVYFNKSINCYPIKVLVRNDLFN